MSPSSTTTSWISHLLYRCGSEKVDGRHEGHIRHAMAERLPAQILRRPKTGKRGTQALLPFLNRLVSQGPLAELISPVSLRRRGWLRAGLFCVISPRRRTELFATIQSIRRRMKFACALAVLEQWAREYLD